MPDRTRAPLDSSKVCPVCGRSFAWRKKWALNWDTVRYCSARCRGRGLTAADRELEEAIPGQLRNAVAIGIDELAPGVDGETVRMAVRRLARAGRLEILAGGRRVGPDEMKGACVVRRGGR